MSSEYEMKEHIQWHKNKKKDRKRNKVWKETVLEKNGRTTRMFHWYDDMPVNTDVCLCVYMCALCVLCMGFSFMHMHACLYLLYACQRSQDMIKAI